MAVAALPVARAGAGAASGGKMAAAAEEEEGAPGGDGGSGRLSELLESGWRLLEEAEAEGGRVEAQRKVQRGIALLERTARAVAELQLFSGNEELEELPSADLRFLPVPALLAALVLKQESPSRRLEHLRRARALFLRFLRLCRDYGLLPQGQMPPERDSEEDSEEPQEEEEEDPLEPSASSSNAPRRRPPASDQAAFLAMAASRRAKIERYKQKKELESRLAALRLLVEAGRAEEEQLREYYLLQIKKWIGISLEELESLDRERAILARRDALKQGSATESPTQPPRPPMKPFILTRDAAQAKVFGAGYPSLATMTVDDWYEQHRKHGGLPDQGISQRSSGITEEQQEEAEGEKEEEGDEAVQKARQWDEWKDSHPRGYGNRKNMG
ncbi:immunoglobulin-binding protein 1 [Sceloporus undulatus]|uniref:immunoglobulin-binding protein 1 n=1 Tax=Sceloporus undulatus TaxID=8520 RepID=UPI001C4AC985|nr:immunoglobulin-binding protein 1 [Sceloporus undulatus]